MALAQIYEGTTDEIVEQLRECNIAGKLRVIVVPENDVETNGKEETGATLAERLKGRVGLFSFGNVNLSEDTGQKFTELLVEKREKE